MNALKEVTYLQETWLKILDGFKHVDPVSKEEMNKSIHHFHDKMENRWIYSYIKPVPAYYFIIHILESCWEIMVSSKVCVKNKTYIYVQITF